MALSGNIESKFAGGSTGGYYIGIDWVVNSQSVSSNSSNVTATVYIRSSGTGYSISSTASKNVSLTMDGSAGSTTNTVGIGVNTRKNLYSRTINIGHDSSGNKTASFSATVGVNVTLSGTYYGNVTASGSGSFNKINLNSAPYWTNDNFRIDNDRTNKYVASNLSSVTLQPASIADNEGNTIYYDIYRYVNDQRQATLGSGLTSTSGWADSGLGSFGEGTKIQYLLQAHDGALWAGDRWSNYIIKNTLSPAYFTGNMPSFVFTHGYGNAYTFTWSNPSNTNGNGNFNCEIWIDGVSTYNRYVGNVRSTTVTVWDGSGTAPTGPYVFRDDIKNYVNNNSPTNKQLNMTARIRTHNDYGVWKDNTANVWVDFRTAPSTPGSITVSTNKTYSTALIAVAGADYWVPNGSRTIRIDWTGSTDYLGGTVTYDLYGKYAGESYSLLASGLTSLARDVVLPTMTAKKSYNFKVVAKTSYGYVSGDRESSAIVLDYYNPPVVTFGALDRKETDFSVPVTTSTNSSISAVIFNAGSRTFSGAASGTITASPQTISKTGLVDATAYTLTVTATDNSGLSGSTTTKSLSIPAYVPIVSIRELGLGVNAFADEVNKLSVGGDVKITGTLNWTKNTDWARISFKNDGDADTDSYLNFNTGDNQNEYFKFSHTSNGVQRDWFNLKNGTLDIMSGEGRISKGGSDQNSITLVDHGNATWFRNESGKWTFQGFGTGDDWTQTFSLRLSNDTTNASSNSVWIDFGQYYSNQADGKIRGVSIVKTAGGSVRGGDLSVGYIQGFAGGAIDVGSKLLSYGATGSEHNQANIELRERGLVTTAQSGWDYAPSMGFHWGGRAAATIAMHSDGQFYFRAQGYSGSQYRGINVGDINMNGHINGTQINGDFWKRYYGRKHWMFHTDSGGHLTFAPSDNDSPDWSKEVKFYASGGIQANGEGALLRARDTVGNGNVSFGWWNSGNTQLGYIGCPSTNWNTHVVAYHGQMILRGTSTAVKNSDNNAWATCYAAAFTTQSSAQWKTNIEKESLDAKEIIKNTKLYSYWLKEDIEKGIYYKKKHGLLYEDSPYEVRDEGGIDLYSMVSLSWKAIQEQEEEISLLKKEKEDVYEVLEIVLKEREEDKIRIDKQEEEIKELKKMFLELKKTITATQ